VQFCSGVDWSSCLLNHDEPLICKTNAMSWWVSCRQNAWINEGSYLVKRVLSWGLAIIIDAQFKPSLNISDWYTLIAVSLVALVDYNDQDSEQTLWEGNLVTCVSWVGHSACYVGHLSNSAWYVYKISSLKYGVTAPYLTYRALKMYKRREDETPLLLLFILLFLLKLVVMLQPPHDYRFYANYWEAALCLSVHP
jgi:hypothetical protein